MFDYLVHNSMVKGVMLVMDTLAENGALRGQDMFRKALFSDNPVIREALDKRYKKDIQLK